MDARRVALAVVAAMVVVSGCAGTDAAPSSEPDGDTATTAVTPPGETVTAEASATTDSLVTTTAPATDSLPPGVNATGVEDAEVLVEAHRSALANDSFSFRFGANVSAGPASQWTVQRGTVGTNLSSLLLHSRSIRHVDGEATGAATDLWANESTVVVRYDQENRTELRLYNRTSGNAGAYDETWDHLPRADLDSQVTQTWLVELALAVGEYDLAGTERRDGDRVAVLRATEPVAAANYTDLNATLVVDGDGRVRSLSLTAAYEGDAETRVHYEFELTETEAASVAPPPWVDAATPPNETTTTVPAEATTTAARDETATTAG